MKSVRIEPVTRGILLIDIVCGCGRNALTNVKTSEPSFKHEVRLWTTDDIYLKCESCQAEYVVHPQRDHIHVSQK